jgi:hypothetical protein
MAFSYTMAELKGTQCCTLFSIKSMRRLAVFNFKALKGVVLSPHS